MAGALSEWSAPTAYRRLLRACRVAFGDDRRTLRAAARLVRHEFETRPRVQQPLEAAEALSQVQEAEHVLRNEIKRVAVFRDSG